MLEKIDIQNYAIIDKISLPFAQGLTTITGETGAGKSILLGALGLIMGKRADTKVLLDPDQKCIVEVVFRDFDRNVSRVLEEADLDVQSSLIIRREILPAGKSRAFVNDTPTTLDVLGNLSTYLLDLHQQWDNLDIHDSIAQSDMLDSYAGNKGLGDEYRELFQTWKDEKDRLKTLELAQMNSIKEKEFNTFLLEELNQAYPVSGEQKSLEEELEWHENAQKIQEVFSKIQHLIQDQDPSIAGMIGELVMDLHGIRNMKENYSVIHERMRSIWEELKDLGREAELNTDISESNPRRAEDIKERLTILYKLQKKHGVHDEEGLLQVWESLKLASEGAFQLDEDIENVKNRIHLIEKKLESIALNLRQNRKLKAITLEAEVKKLLEQLKMEHAKFVIQIENDTKFNSRGMDTVQWLFAANKGSNLQPIKAVASGGEVSRLNLCIKSVLAQTMTLPTLIFDEIDAGVSGDVAHKMGDLLSSLSNNHQIISITHSPQVAAKAKQQVFVSKDNTGHKTVTKLKYITGSERIREIAVMLSSDPPPPSALETAKQLIEST